MPQARALNGLGLRVQGLRLRHLNPKLETLKPNGGGGWFHWPLTPSPEFRQDTGLEFRV